MEKKTYSLEAIRKARHDRAMVKIANPNQLERGNRKARRRAAALMRAAK